MTKFTENQDFNDFLINKPVWANRRLIFAIFNTDRNTGRQTDERIKARTNEQTNPIRLRCHNLSGKIIDNLKNNATQIKQRCRCPSQHAPFQTTMLLSISSSLGSFCEATLVSDFMTSFRAPLGPASNPEISLVM